MKRSEINRAIENGMEFFRKHQFLLPPFAYFTPEEWSKQEHCSEIVDLQLGWDVTTFGSNHFEHTGLLLFTLRNGKLASQITLGSPLYPKPYAEKIMMVLENQITPRHFHWNKREDIINRGGGNLVIELYHADPACNKLTGMDFNISVDGFLRRMKSGDKLILRPGDSVCLEAIHCHTFYGEPGKGPVLVGEVSMVNDDSTDNCFVDGAPRFDPIEEDEPPRHLLAMDLLNRQNAL